MTTRKTIIPLTVALVAILATAALAQGPGPRRGRGPAQEDGFPRLERLAARLDLTEDQVQAAQELREQGRAAGVERRKAIMRLQHDLQGEMLKDDPSAAKVAELTRKIGDLKTAAQVQRAENRLAFRKLLTPEQRDKMLASGPGRGHGPGRHGGPGARDGGGGCDGGCCGKGGPGRGHR